MSPHFLVNTLLIFLVSLVDRTTLAMTYGIKVCPYNEPYIKLAEKVLEAIAEFFIPGAFLVDVIPISKYVPEWFPDARFQSKAAMMRKDSAIIRNATFAATKILLVCGRSHSY